MPVVEVRLTVRVDGVDLQGFPIVRTMTPAELDTQRYSKANGDGSSYVQVSQLATDNLVIVGTDTAVNLRINGQTNGSVPLQAGGFFILVNGNVNAGATTNVTVNNQAANAALINFIEAGP